MERGGGTALPHRHSYSETPRNLWGLPGDLPGDLPPSLAKVGKRWDTKKRPPCGGGLFVQKEAGKVWGVPANKESRKL